MRIIDVSVNWMTRYANRPTFEIKIEGSLPSLETATFRAIPLEHGTLYFGTHEDSPIVHFFYHDSQNERGYAGTKFDLTMSDGSTVSLVGPWSSRAGVVNRYVNDHILDVTLIPSDGYRMSGAIRVEDVREWLATNKPEILVEQYPFDDLDIRYEPKHIVDGFKPES